MNAEPLLSLVADALKQAGLEAVLIGNAAAALQGAPVTTLDFDFCFRDTPVNRRKLAVFAKRLNAVISMPRAPVSRMTRVECDDTGLQVDFLPDQAIGVRLAALRSRAARVTVGGRQVWVADLEDVAAGKRKADRPKDRAALYVIETTLKERARQARATPDA
ncbi:MAG: hypothetical protein FJ279_04750 [Planctomycetes bacterium]|nr:hypothetical protein [Verrucomicrobiota bacterium]MBM4044402.1 hypothetical protein [Planctomycetota bacterium]